MFNIIDKKKGIKAHKHTNYKEINIKTINLQ